MFRKFFFTPEKARFDNFSSRETLPVYVPNSEGTPGLTTPSGNASSPSGSLEGVFYVPASDPHRGHNQGYLSVKPSGVHDLQVPSYSPSQFSSPEGNEQFHSCVMSSPEEMRFHEESSSRTPEYLKEPNSKKVDFSKSNERRYSNVVAEFVRRRNSLLDREVTSINPSTILALQADQAGPLGVSYVSWPLDISDESVEIVHEIDQSTEPLFEVQRSIEDRPRRSEQFLPAFNVISDAGSLSPKDLEFSSKSPFEQPMQRNEESGNHIRENGRSTSKKSVKFGSSPGVDSPDYIPPFDGINVKLQPLASTSTPIPKLDPKLTTFTPMSGRSSISCCSPISNRDSKTPMIKELSSTKKDIRNPNTFIVTTPKFSMSNRGSYAVSEGQKQNESPGKKNMKCLNICLTFTGLLGIMQIVAAFLIWFLLIPHLEEEQEMILLSLHETPLPEAQ